MSHVDFKECRTFWEKVDKIRKHFVTLKETTSCVDHVFVEEPLMGFRTGMSSATTITTLMRFNGIVSMLAREAYGHDPEYIGSAHARKLCGVKLQQKIKCGLGHKEQTFTFMAEHDLKDVVWERKKRSNKIVDWAGDVVDAYVIARAGLITAVTSV
jgi:hypothetical protein